MKYFAAMLPAMLVIVGCDEKPTEEAKGDDLITLVENVDPRACTSPIAVDYILGDLKITFDEAYLAFAARTYGSAFSDSLSANADQANLNLSSVDMIVARGLDKSLKKVECGANYQFNGKNFPIRYTLQMMVDGSDVVITPEYGEDLNQRSYLDVQAEVARMVGVDLSTLQKAASTQDAASPVVEDESGMVTDIGEPMEDPDLTADESGGAELEEAVVE